MYKKLILLSISFILFFNVNILGQDTTNEVVNSTLTTNNTIGIILIAEIFLISTIVLFFRKSKYKKESKKLYKNNELLMNEKKDLIDDFSKKLLEKDNIIKNLKNTNTSNNSDETKKEKFKKEIQDLKEEIQYLKEEIQDLNKKNISLYVDEFIFDNLNNLNSEDCKNKLSMNRIKQKEFLKEEKAIKNIKQEIFNQNIIDRNNKKQLISCFQAESSNLLNSLNLSNSDKIREKIIKSFDNLNKIFKTDNINLTKKFLELKLNELNLLVEIAKKQQEEKETQKAIREQLIEEEKVRKEIEKEKIKIEKEEKQFNNEMSKMLSYLQKANNDIEKQIYADKIKELEEKIKLLEKDKENVLQRETNTRAGFVYIISNIGSFGENIFKIGMTRRLEPMDRISELSSASVPFPFDVHAIIFSEDAPSLENSLHKYFQDKSVNKVNLRKEFFKIDIEELKSYIIDELNQNVNFVDIPEAEQYRQSCLMI